MKKNVLLALIILTALIFTGRTPTQAADFNVACSFTELRDLINDTTNSNNAADTLNLAADCTYTFTENIFIQPDGGNTLTINGNGATFDGQSTHQFFNTVRPAIVEINDVTLRNGRSPAGEQGGAIINHGDLTINRSTFTGNFSDADGGAISTQGDTTLTITGSTFTGNSADNGSFGGGGGAIRIFDDASVIIDSSMFDSNTANGNGGAIGFAVNNNNAGSLMIRSSTFYQNQTLQGDGAAVQARLAAGADASSLSLTVEDTTISENSAGVESIIGNGGAFYIYRESGGGTATFDFTLTNTILANNTASETGGNCFANNDEEASVPVPAITSGGFNYITDSSCDFTPATGDQVNVPLALGALADNGGPTQTVFFASNSPVVDASNCDTSTDQRGEPRPVDLTGVDGPGNSCDIGAVERQPDDRDCPDGTPGDDVILCNVSIGTLKNLSFLFAGQGSDQITLVSRGRAWRIYADEPGAENGDDDTITIESFAGTIYGDRTTTTGGNDTITITETGRMSQISGDGLSDNQTDADLYGGDDVITVEQAFFEDAGAVYGDDIRDEGTGTVYGGNDTIINRTATLEYLFGDDLFGETIVGGNDRLENHGDVVWLFGEGFSPYDVSGDDVIINTGIAAVIYGDGYNDAPDSTGGNDTIINSGTVFAGYENDLFNTSAINGGGGNDTVILEDGANGGSEDNLLNMDGGDGTDVLRFAFTNMDQSTINQLLAANPAGDSITIGGQTYEWVAFESIEVTNATGTLAFDGGSGSVSEDAGTYNVDVVLTVEASGNATLDSPVTVDVGYSGAGAAAVSGPASVTFDNTGGFSTGTYTETLALTITDDSNVTGDRNAVLTLTSPDGASLGTPSQHTLTLTENDIPATGTVAFDLASGSAAENAGTVGVDVVLTVTGDTTLASPVSVDVSYNSTEISGPAAVSFTNAGGFPAGTYTETLQVTLTDNDADDGDRQATIDLSNPSGATLANPSQHVLNIIDDDSITPADVPTNLYTEGRLDLAPATPVLRWVGVQGATSYRVYMQYVGGAGMVIDTTADAATICTGVVCALPTVDLLDGWGLIDINASGEDFEWWVGADGTAWSQRAAFAVDLAPAALPQVTVDPNQGRPTVSFPDDPGTAWVQFWLGPSPWGDYLAWHGRGAWVDENTPSFTCDGTTCRIDPAWDAPAGVEYTIWIQAWGPGGFSAGGPVPAAPSWTNGNTFSYPTQPAALPGVPDVASYDGDQPVFGWQSGARTTWYHLVVTTADDYTVLYDNWHPAAQLDCAEPGETCILGDLGLSLANGTTYKLYLQAWGPGGLSTGGDLPSAPGWVEGEFIYQP